MLLPGREWQEGYRFGFNGQEKLNEYNQSINTATYWEMDSRLARRFNLDPKPRIEVSPYVILINSPLSFKDILGDTTLFINGITNEIMASITAQKVDGNYAIILTNLSENEISQFRQLKSTDPMEAGRGYALAIRHEVVYKEDFVLYDLSSLQTFFRQYSKHEEALVYPVGWDSDKLFNDESGEYKRVDKLYNELMIPLKKSGRLISVDFDFLNSEESKKYPRGPFDSGPITTRSPYGTAHLHPNPRGTYATPAATGGWTKYSEKGFGPSGNDYTQSGAKSKYYDIAIDNQNIYFYRNNSGQMNEPWVTIPMNLSKADAKNIQK